jgi:hypothetical protein
LPAGAESSVEVFERLLETDLGGIKLAHSRGQAILGEIVWIDPARRRDQLHRAHRRLVVAVGQHVDVGVSDPLPVQLARRFRQPPVRQRPLVHEGS